MFGNTKRRLDRIENRLRSIDSREDGYSLRMRVQQLEDELALLVQALGLVRVSRKIDTYEKKDGPEQP